MLYDMNFNLYLIRHGESEVNIKPDEMGQTADVKLTKNGKNQAKLLGQYFNKKEIAFDKIFSSPYERAMRTAKIVTKNINNDNCFSSIEYAPELREYDAGNWTGASRKATMTPEVLNKMNILNQTFLPPNGESMNQVERRASKWLEDSILYNEDMWELCDFHHKINDRKVNIFAFSHGMTIKTLLHYIMGFDRNFTWKISILNTSVTKLHFGKNGWALDYINNTSHLND